jgi:5-methylcytosine-specific restriction endonuclease McrA
MKRTRMKRTGFRAARARKRLRPVSKKTREGRWLALRTLRKHVLARAKGKCEFVAGTGHDGPVDCHHVVKRSQGGADDASNLVALCRRHHQDTDRPFSKTRLVVTPLGAERFEFAEVTVRDKWEAKAGQ